MSTKTQVIILFIRIMPQTNKKRGLWKLDENSVFFSEGSMLVMGFVQTFVFFTEVQVIINFDE